MKLLFFLFVVITISGFIAENGMASPEYGEYDGSVMKRNYYPNLGIFPKRWTSRQTRGHRIAFKPLFYSPYKTPARMVIEEPESDESEAAERLSVSEDKRNTQPKNSGETGKDGKDDFDSNSYFMLRPLRRIPQEKEDRPNMFNILGNSTKIAKKIFAIRWFKYLCHVSYM